MNELLATGPFDLYELQLFHLVAEHRNFTRAGRAAGLTQSAITRQIAGMEARLGVRLFERSTRSVELTAAGAALHARSGAILSGVDDAVKALRKRFDLGPAILRVGISRTIGLAYWPGFFHRFQKRNPTIQLRVSHQSSAFILAAIESGELEAGLVSKPSVLSKGISVLKEFQDEFVFIAPPNVAFRRKTAKPASALEGWKWILISEESVTGKQMRAWLRKQGIRPEIIMEADSFDLIANLVSLGMGVSLVPHRVLALQGNRRPVSRLIVKPKFSRELLVVARRQNQTLPGVREFADSVLF